MNLLSLDSLKVEPTSALPTFQWDARYETGIALVDAQHQTLVAMLNMLIAVLTGEHAASPDEILALLDELDRYARLHFADEERVMREGGYAAHECDKHARQHAVFAEQIGNARNEYLAAAHPIGLLESLARFVTSWLSFHILGSDMQMARQIRAAGENSPDLAEVARNRANEAGRTEVLVDAMQQVYTLMAERNAALAAARDELALLNASLEQRVSERTADLQAALDELGRTREQLLQSEKMSAIGRLAAGVAHEINNPIGFVSSNLGTLRQYVEGLVSLVDKYDRIHARLPLTESGRAKLKALKDAIDYDFLRDDIGSLLAETGTGVARVKRIVEDMRSFSDIGEFEPQPTDLNALVESLVPPLANDLEGRAGIVCSCEPLPPVACLPTQIAQVLTNLLSNAAQAVTPPDGQIELKTRSVGEAVEIEVTDNGCGMSADVVQHVFEPFYTTRPPGQGVGLGLSLSYEIIKRHRGQIDVTSEPGKGTRVVVHLPLLQ